MVRLYPFAGAYVLDRDIQIVVQSSRARTLTPALTDVCRKALRTGTFRIELLGDTPGKTIIALTAPVFPGPRPAKADSPPGTPLGMTLVVMDAAQTLFPLLQREGVPTRTAETILVRRGENDLVFFSPLRHVPAGSRNLRFSLPNAPLPARAAVEGREVPLESTDYRGVPVLAESRRIPMTGWGLVRKIDRAEALENLRHTARTEALAGALLLAALGGLLAAHRRHTLTAVLKAEAEKFRGLLESAPDAMVIVDPDGRIALVNAQAVRTFGYSRGSLLSRPFEMLVPERFRGRPAESWWRVPNPSDTLAHCVVSDVFGQRQDGSEFPAEATLGPIETPEGPVVCVAIRDITQRKRAEESLRKNEATLAEAQRISHVGSWESDLTDNKFTWSEELDRIFGFEPGFVVPTLELALNAVDPGDRERVKQALENSIHLNTPYDIEFRVIHPDGTERFVHSRAKVVRNAAGKPLQMVGSLQDITERKQAEQSLKDSEEQIHLLLDSAAEGIYGLDQEGKVTLCNRSCLELLGYQHPSDLLGKSIHSLCHHTRPDGTPYPIESCRAHSVIHKSEGAHIDDEVYWRSDGTSFPAEYWSYPIRKEGKVVGCVVTFLDISLRRQAEHDLRTLNQELELRVRQRTVELEAANKELEAFTYSVSHDLRAPLRHIDGFSKILMEEDLAGLSEDSRRYLTRIREGTKQMGQLVDDLLNLARVGRKEVALQVTGLSSLVQEAAEEIKRENSARSIEWKIAPLPFVDCDPGLMKQVFVNLLSNAAKYTRPRQHALIEVGTLSDNGQSVVFVRDNGVGFSMKYADKLFGVFQRLHRAEDFEGTGIGLATVQRILHKHGGRVWAEAELDKGATFYFTLGSGEGQKGSDKVSTVGAEGNVA
jgi:PAS domain S-box-containing protein